MNRSRIVLLALVVIAAVAVSTVVFRSRADPLPAGADQVTQMQYAINVYRYAIGIPTLPVAPHLRQASDLYALYLSATCRYSHTDEFGRGPGDRIWSTGYPRVAVGEILEANNPTPAGGFAGWMASPEHRAIISDPQYRGIGVSIVSYAPWCPLQNVWVVEFGASDER